MVHNHRMMKMKQQQVTITRKQARKQKFAPLMVEQTKHDQQTVHGLMRVTLDVARELLANHNNFNRPLRRGKDYLNVLAHMNAGTFYNHTDLIFDPEGELLNGQHRLTALIESGKAQVFTIKCGFNREETLCNTDTGSNRTDTNQVKFLLQEERAWEKENLTLAQWKVVNYARNWQKWLSVTDLNLAGSQVSAASKKQTHAELKKFLKKHKNTIVAVAKKMPKSFNGIKANRWSFVTPFMMMWKIDASKAEDFLFKFVAGGQPKSCPTSKVRQLLGETSGDVKKKQPELAAFIIFAMQRFLDGQKIRKGAIISNVQFSN
jgi:hypothetical protein